jgi:hypothetical protein
MVQTVASRDVSEAVNIFDTTTTGNVTIGTGMTSGTASMFSNASRTGSIAIGHSASSGIISIDSGSSATNFNSSTMTLNTDTGPLNLTPADAQVLSLHGSATRSGAIGLGHASSSGTITIDAGSGNTSINGGTMTLATDTGTLAITPADALALTLHNSATRSGVVNIGHASSNGAITIDAGSGNTSINGGTMTLATDTGTLAIKPADALALTLHNSATRSGVVNIGHASSSGAITVDAGTGALNLSGSNHVGGTWSIGISDVTGNAGTVGSVTANYSRVDNMVTCSILMNITGKGSMIAGEEFRITGLPFASVGSSVSGSVHGPFINSGPTGIYRIFCENASSNASVRINDSVAPTDRDLLVSEMTTGFIYGNFTYWV